MLTETKARRTGRDLYGLMAEFEPAGAAAGGGASGRTRQGYRNMDAYTPMPVEGLAEAIGFRSTLVQRIVLVAGLLGATGGFMLCWWMTVVAFPHNVAGRPLNSWPAYVPITFESHGAGGLPHGRGRDAGAERAAAAVSSGVQRAGIRARLARQVFPVHRSHRSEVRSRGHARVSGAAAMPRR